MIGTVPDAALAATRFLDHDHPAVTAFVDRHTTPDAPPVQRAVELYYAVRDRVRYDIYDADLSRGGLRASTVATGRVGLCLHKSVLYAAGMRSIGVPARLVLADVRNHLTSDRLRGLMGSDIFHHHCYTRLRLAGRWVTATPVFNRQLCRLFGMEPLEFDGVADSVHHPFDTDGRRYMEFLRVHGEFDDLPYARVIADLHDAHPGLFADRTRVVGGSLPADVARPA